MKRRAWLLDQQLNLDEFKWLDEIGVGYGVVNSTTWELLVLNYSPYTKHMVSRSAVTFTTNTDVQVDLLILKYGTALHFVEGDPLRG